MLKEDGPPKINPSEKAISFKMPERKGMKFKDKKPSVSKVLSADIETKVNKYERSKEMRKFEGTKLDTFSLSAIVTDKIKELNTDLDPTIYKALD